MLYRRILTAAVLIPLALAGIFLLSPKFFVDCALAVFLVAAWEMAEFFWPKRFGLKLTFVVFIALSFWLTQLISPLPILLIGGAWWLCVPLFLRRYELQVNLKSICPIFLYGVGFCTLVPALDGIVTLRFDFGSKYLLLVLSLVWATDIGAFFIGKYFGRHKLANSISPHKTVEGVFGGVAAALLVAVAAGVSVHLHILAWGLWLLLVVVTVLWSMVGDLFESMLKRIAGLKDSGMLLPGHGGFYDRIDSVTAAVPIFTLGLLLLRI